MRTTIHDVARAAGTSVTTVSRALNRTGRVSAATRRSIIDIAQDLDYRPGGFPAARVTYTVVVVVSDLTNPFFPELLDSVCRSISEEQSLMLVSPEPTWHSLAALRRRRADGMILIGTGIDEAHLQAVTSGIPVVALDREVDLPTASVVRSDHAGGARLATEHLLRLGHQRIAHLAGPAGLQVTDLRLAGYSEALDGRLAPELVAHCDLGEKGGYRAMNQVLDTDAGPTAVFAANDLSAIGALSALEARGIRVPEDVSVIGFDDILLASYTRPRLSTVRQHAAQLGVRAARLVLDLAHGGDASVPVHEILPVELVLRESTCPPPETP